MKTPEKLEQLTRLNIDYIAGFFDGEGCINISKSGLRVVFTNNRKDILREIQFYFSDILEVSSKIGVVGKKVRKKEDNAKTECYQLVYWSKNAEDVIALLKPYLRIKKREAELALRFRLTYGVKGIKLSNKTISIRNKLINICHQLKFDGRSLILT